MARISTYAIDGTPVSSDKLIGTDSSGTTTKNYPLGSVSDWLKESGASAVLGQNNYSFQIALDPDAGRLPGSFSFENYGGDGTEFTDVSRLMVSNLSSTGKYVGDYLLSTVGDRVMLGQLDDLNSFGVYTLVSLVQNPIEPTFYDAELLFVEGNGALLGNKLYGLATYSASASAESAVWGSIEGTVTNQTDLVDYIDAEIAAIPVPATPTLQTVTDEGNTTTNNIGIGTVVLRSSSYLNVKPTSNYGVLVRNSGNDSRYISMGVPGDYGFIKYKENSASAITLNAAGVGIGTTAPTLPLDVVASEVKFSGSGNMNFYTVPGVSSHFNFYNIRQNSDYVFKQNVGGIVGTSTVIFKGDTGNVGIGTTAPSEKLQVSSGNILLDTNTWIGSGSGSGQPRLRFDNTNSQGKLQQADLVLNDEKSVAWSNTGTSIQGRGVDNQRIEFNVASSEKMRITSTGNVGIGTTAPSALLEIKSNSTNDFLKLTTGGGGATPVKLIFEKTVNEQGIIEYNRNGNLEIYNTDGDGGVLISGSGSANADMYINHAGNVGIGTTAPTEILSVGDVNTYNTTAAIESNGFGTTTLRLTRQNNSYTLNNNGNFYIAGPSGTALFIDTTSNVGIGTTAPGKTLDIRTNGTGDGLRLATSENALYAEIINGNSESFPYGKINLKYGPTFTAGIVALSHSMELSGGYTTGGYIRFRSYTTEVMRMTNVGLGIGTTAPAEKLHVDGNIRTSSGTGLGVGIDTIYSNSVNINNSGQYRIGNAEFISKSANDMNIYQGRMWVTNTGNVGIGNTAPLAKLHVKDGNTLTAALPNTSALIEGFSQSILQVASHSTGYSQLAFGDQDDGFDGGLIYSNASRYLAIEAANVERMRFTANGRVGIGTTVPTEKLHVNGGIKVNGNIQLDGNSRVIKTIDDTDLIFGTNDTSNVWIKNSGNVGIGTNAPAYKLDVVGASRVQNELTLGDNTGTAGILHFRNPGFGSYIQSNGYYIFNTLRSVGNQFRIKHATASSEFDIKTLADDGVWYLTPRGPNNSNGKVVIRNPNNSDKFVFDTNAGNLGIGTTAPAAKLDVDGQVHLGPQSTTGFPSIDIASSGRTTIRASAPALSVRDENNNGGYIDMGGGTLANINSITSASTLLFSSTNVRFGGDIASRVNIVGQANSSQKVLGLKQGSSGSNIMIDIRNSSNVSTMGITSEGGFYFRDSNLVSRYTFDHDYSASPADGLTIGIDFRTENASGVVESLGYIDVTQDDISADESSMRLSVGETTPTEVMRLRSDGNVGIGTTAPAYKLDVNGDARVDSYLRFSSAGTYLRNNSSGALVLAANSGYIETGWGARFRVRAQSGSDTIMLYGGGDSYINGGNLGIGTTAPDSKLHVSAASGIAFKVNPNNVDKEWYIDTTNPDHLKKEGNLILNADPTGVHTSTKISFNIDGSNKASINSDGDLGVGTTAQTSKVHVDGTAMRQLRMGTAGGPSSNTDTSGAVGDMAYDDNYFYIKTASGWGRVQLDFGF